MTALLTLDRISAQTPDGRMLFGDLSLSVGRERTGLVGRNGSGKSTLLHIMAGNRSPHDGHVTRVGRIALVDQDLRVTGSVAEALGKADDLARLQRLEQGIGSVEDAADADWELHERLAQTLADVGLAELALDRDAASLSGGERSRLALAAAMLDAPDVLLLDEPTNNLDADGRAAISSLLAKWQGGLVVASHDRALLEQVDRIVAISSLGVDVFGGGWSAFAEARAAESARIESAMENAERNLVSQKRAVQAEAEKKAQRDKHGRAHRARGGASKMFFDAEKQRAENSMGRSSRVGDRLLGDAQAERDQARSRLEIVTPLRIDLPESGLPANRILLTLEEVELERSGRRLFGPLSLVVEGPQRWSLSGANGSGKTSLLRIIAGEEEPTAGHVSRGGGRIAMLDQHVSIIDAELSLVDNMLQHYPEMSSQEARAVLARFAFRNRDAEKLGGSLSGGERLRAGLAMAMGGPEPVQLLILDEPTNHLDIDNIETLEAALRDFDGALIVVSHDAAFLDAIGIDHRIDL